VIDASTLTVEIPVREDANLDTAEQADRADRIIETSRHGGPILARLQAEIVALKISVSIEACPGLGGPWPAPFILGDYRQGS
jgi:hypothetical protein